MKKILSCLTLIAGCLLFTNQAWSAPVTTGIGIYIEHRTYDTNFFTNTNRVYTSIWWEGNLDGETVSIFEVKDPSGNIEQLAEDSGTGAWAVPPGTTGYYGQLGLQYDTADYDLSDWRGTYDFTLKTDQNASGYTFSKTIRDAAFAGIIDTPIVLSTTDKIVTWAPVFGADSYRLRLLDPANWDNLLYQSDSLYDTSYDLSGLVNTGTYILRIEAKDNFAGELVGRGTYITQITVTPIPGSVLFIGSGLLLITGYRRKEN